MLFYFIHCYCCTYYDIFYIYLHFSYYYTYQLINCVVDVVEVMFVGLFVPCKSNCRIVQLETVVAADVVVDVVVTTLN